MLHKKKITNFEKIIYILFWEKFFFSPFSTFLWNFFVFDVIFLKKKNLKFLWIFFSSIYPAERISELWKSPNRNSKPNSTRVTPQQFAPHFPTKETKMTKKGNFKNKSSKYGKNFEEFSFTKVTQKLRFFFLGKFFLCVTCFWRTSAWSAYGVPYETQSVLASLLLCFFRFSFSSLLLLCSFILLHSPLPMLLPFSSSSLSLFLFFFPFSFPFSSSFSFSFPFSWCLSFCLRLMLCFSSFLLLLPSRARIQDSFPLCRDRRSSPRECFGASRQSLQSP